MWYRGELVEDINRIFDHHETAFPNNLDIMVVKVDPRTNCISDDESLNIHTRVWLEVSTFTELDPKNPDWYDKFKGSSRHDYWLDCGGNTFEDAVIELAERVYDHYGLYGRPLSGQWYKYVGEPRNMEID